MKKDNITIAVLIASVVLHFLIVQILIHKSNEQEGRMQRMIEACGIKPTSVSVIGDRAREEECLTLALQCAGCETDQECYDCVQNKARKEAIDCRDVDEILESISVNPNQEVLL